MSRTLHELSPAEKNAYNVWQSKLADRTLSAAEHDECRREIDNLLWKGPNAQVLAVKAQMAEVLARLERIEFHMGLSDEGVQPAKTVVTMPVGNSLTGAQKAEPKVNHVADFVIRDGEPKVYHSGDGVIRYVETGTTDPPNVDAPKPDGRGRPKNRYAPEKDANKKWRILDRETGAYATDETFPRRKDAADAANLLNDPPAKLPEPIADYLTDAPVEDDPLADLGF